jgi:hypothetical protein
VNAIGIHRSLSLTFATKMHSGVYMTGGPVLPQDQFNRILEMEKHFVITSRSNGGYVESDYKVGGKYFAMKNFLLDSDHFVFASEVKDPRALNYMVIELSKTFNSFYHARAFSIQHLDYVLCKQRFSASQHILLMFFFVFPCIL